VIIDDPNLAALEPHVRIVVDGIERKRAHKIGQSRQLPSAPGRVATWG
jgi:hypothetical protein